MAAERIYGLHAVRAILTKRPAAVVRLTVQAGREDQRLKDILLLAKQAGLAVEVKPAASLSDLTGGAPHQGVIAEVTPALALDEDALMEGVGARLEAGQAPFVLVLDGVQDPHNLGACLRTADAAGVDFVIAPRDRATGLTPVVRKVAAGAAESTPFVQVTNLARTLREIKDLGVWLVGTSDNAQTSFYHADMKGALGIVMGAAGTGLRRLTRELCDTEVVLPMLGAVESLNVSVATGIVLYEALRQRAS